MSLKLYPSPRGNALIEWVLDVFHFGNQIGQCNQFGCCPSAGQDNLNVLVPVFNEFSHVFQFRQPF